jgi:hypothetical protein
MLKTNPDWKDTELYLKTLVNSAEEGQQARRRLAEFTTRSRLEAKVEAVRRLSSEDPFLTIKRSSQAARLAFIGIKPPDEEETLEEYTRYYSGLLGKTEGFPPLAIVMGAENIEFHRIFE